MSHDQPGSPGPQAWLPGDLPAPAPEPQPAYQPQPAFQPPSAFGGPTAQPGFGPASQPGYPTSPGYPGPAPYGQPAYYGPPAPKRTPVLAILSLVFAFLAPLVGLVLAIVALLRGKVDGNGRGLAIAGLVTSLVMTPLYAAVALPLVMQQRERAEEAGVEQAFAELILAIADGDCDAYLAGTTFALQQQTHATTCAQFDVLFAQAGEAGAWPDGVRITDVRVDVDDAWLTTAERVVWDDATSSVETYEYWMVREDGAWLLNSVDMVE